MLFMILNIHTKFIVLQLRRQFFYLILTTVYVRKKPIYPFGNWRGFLHVKKVVQIVVVEESFDYFF